MKKSLSFLASGALVIFLNSAAFGQIVAVQDFSGGSQNDSISDWSYGYKFTVQPGRTLSVSDLGLLDLGAAGFVDQHRVSLWSGTTLLGEVTFDPGVSGTELNGFRYLPLASPATLDGGSTYSLGFYQTGTSDKFVSNIPVDSFTFSPDLDFVGATADPGYGPASTVHSSLNYGNVGGNMQYGPVPEPQTYALMTGAGLCAFAVWRKVRTRRAGA